MRAPQEYVGMIEFNQELRHRQIKAARYISKIHKTEYKDTVATHGLHTL